MVKTTTTIITAIQANAQSHEGEFIRLSTKGDVESYTYSDLLHRAQNFALAYQSKKIAPRSVIFIIAGTNIDAIAAYIGAWLINAVPAFLAPLTGKQQPDIYWRTLNEILCAYPGSLLVVDDQMGAEIKAGQLDKMAAAHVLCFPLPRSKQAQLEVFEQHSDDTAFIQFSSGTTGLRKGVPITHEMMFAHLDAFQKSFAFEKDDRVVSWLPLYHDMGLIACLMVPLLTGVPVVGMDTKTGAALFSR